MPSLPGKSPAASLDCRITLGTLKRRNDRQDFQHVCLLHPLLSLSFCSRQTKDKHFRENERHNPERIRSTNKTVEFSIFSDLPPSCLWLPRNTPRLIRRAHVYRHPSCRCLVSILVRFMMLDACHPAFMDCLRYSYPMVISGGNPSGQERKARQEGKAGRQGARMHCNRIYKPIMRFGRRDMCNLQVS